MLFHVLNRGVGRMRLFDDDDDYAAFERVLTETLEIQPMRVCASVLSQRTGHAAVRRSSDQGMNAPVPLYVRTGSRREHAQLAA